MNMHGQDAHEVHAMRLKQLLLNTERQCTFALEHSGITISMAICRDDVTAAQREVGAMKQSFVKRLPVSSSTTLAPSSVAATGKVVAGASSPADAAKTANALATTLPSPSLASNTIPLPPAINVLATPPPSPSSASNTQTTLAVAAKASSPVPSAAQKAKKKKKASAAYPYSVLSKETTDFIKSFKNYLKTHHLSAHTHGPLRDSTITNRINHVCTHMHVLVHSWRSVLTIVFDMNRHAGSSPSIKSQSTQPPSAIGYTSCT